MDDVEDDTEPLLVPGQPLSVGTRVVTPESVLVTWQAPVDGGPVAGYMIGYGEGVPDVNWQYLEAYRRNVTIKNLSRSLKDCLHRPSDHERLSATSCNSDCSRNKRYLTRFCYITNMIPFEGHRRRTA